MSYTEDSIVIIIVMLLGFFLGAIVFHRPSQPNKYVSNYLSCQDTAPDLCFHNTIRFNIDEYHCRCTTNTEPRVRMVWSNQNNQQD